MPFEEKEGWEENWDKREVMRAASSFNVWHH